MFGIFSYLSLKCVTNSHIFLQINPDGVNAVRQIYTFPPLAMKRVLIHDSEACSSDGREDGPDVGFRLRSMY